MLQSPGLASIHSEVPVEENLNTGTKHTVPLRQVVGISHEENLKMFQRVTGQNTGLLQTNVKQNS